MNYKKPFALVLSLALAAPVAGCASRGGKDARNMEIAVASYIEAFAADDDLRAATLTDYFEYYVDDPQALLSDGVIPETLRGVSLLGVCLYAASRAQIVDNEAPDINREDGTATMTIELSYIDLHDLYEDSPSEFMSYDEYVTYINEFDDFATAELDIGFIWEPISKTWLISEGSARELNALFVGNRSLLNAPVNISADEARTYVEEFMQGDYSNLTGGALDVEAFRGFENTTERGEGTEAIAAIGRFAEAYMAYVREHDYEITASETDPYLLTIHGSAPSPDDLFASLRTHEFYVQYYVSWIRYSNLDWYREETMDDITILIYDSMTAAIADAEPVDYTLSVEVDADGTADEFFTFQTDIMPEPLMGLYEADHSLNNDEFVSVNVEALQILHDNMEISQERMDMILNSLYSQYGEQPTGLETNYPENMYGRANQAVDVRENAPSEQEDEMSRETVVTVTGSSMPDENNFWMFYSRDPEIIDAVAYYIDGTGIYVTVYFCDTFDESTVYYGAWRYQEELVDQREYSFPRSGSTQLEAHYEISQFPEPGVYEFTLYPSEGSNILAYVRIVNAGD